MIRPIIHQRSPLTRISHTPSTAARDQAVSTSLRSFAVLNILFKYASARRASRASYPRPCHAPRYERCEKCRLGHGACNGSHVRGGGVSQAPCNGLTLLV